MEYTQSLYNSSGEETTKTPMFKFSSFKAFKQFITSPIITPVVNNHKSNFYSLFLNQYPPLIISFLIKFVNSLLGWSNFFVLNLK